MTPNAATGVEHDLVAEARGVEGMDPVQELRFVLVVHLDEVTPLPSEGTRGVLGLVGEMVGQQSRDATSDRVPAPACLACELAFDDLAGGVRRRVTRPHESPAAHRAGHEVEESGLHGAAPR